MGRWRRRLLALLAGVAASACAGGHEQAAPATTTAVPATGAVRIGPLTPTDPGRIAPEQVAAIHALAVAASAQAPDPHAAHVGHGGGGAPPTTLELTGDDRATFERQWSTALGAVSGLDTPAEATAAGYTRAAVAGAGVGVHWVNWTLIDAPFDPARPAMLLFDERHGRVALAGFSYWVRTDRPEGFAGPNDVWHQHTNLCIVNGWVDRELSASAADCAGDFLAGSDLWMLHAWVVPDLPNRWGDFAVLHPALCPPAAGTPDVARCPAASG